MTSVVTGRTKQSPYGRVNVALTRCHGVCRHFWGNTLRGRGECRLHDNDVIGQNTTDCEDWTRRVEGVDEIPFGKVEDKPVPPPPAPPAPVAVKAPPAPKPPKAPKPNKLDRIAAERADRHAKLPALIAQGLSGEQLAAALNVSEATIFNDTKRLGLHIERKPKSGPQQPSPHALETRQKIADLIRQGASVREIQGKLGMGRQTVWNHLYALDMRPCPPPAAPNPVLLERAARIRELADSGCEGPEIARRLGISQALVYSDASKHGIKIGTKGLGGPCRREDVLALAAQGMSGAAIARKLGAAKSTVSRHLRAPDAEAPEAQRERILARRDRVKEMAGKGMRLSEMARVEGVHESTIQNDLQRLGMKLPTGRPMKPQLDQETANAVAALRECGDALHRLADALERSAA